MKRTMKKTAYNIPFIEQRADPYVYRDEDGSYYFTASVPEYDRLILRHANTLEGLRTAEERVLWTRHLTGPQSANIWAPELHKLDGTYYIYYAGGDIDDVFEIRPYVLVCDGNPMTGAWRELGPMLPADNDPFSFQGFSLDATIFPYNGEYYYIWAEKVGVGKQISNLYIARMASPNKLATVQVLLTTPDYDWERVDFWVNEGPAILRHNGKIFLTFSASATGECYCMGMLWAEEGSDLLDPLSWHKLRWPVLRSDDEKGIYGPGHNTFVLAEDGMTELCFFHARQYPEIIGNPLYDPNRHAMYLTVRYDEKGFPVFEYEAHSDSSTHI
ncbi:MAG: family 43 glycosylhydrolase [Candidatus Onthomonas sp.]